MRTYRRMDGRTDGETHMTKLIIAFCGFTNARKMSMTLKIAAYFAFCFVISISAGEVQCTIHTI
jgi:hypothetical protein